MMRQILFFLLVTVTVSGFQLHTTRTYPTWTTQSLKACSEAPTARTRQFCATRDQKLYSDPTDNHWYIDCEAGGICKPCDHDRILVLNEICQTCVGPADQTRTSVCPTTHPILPCDNVQCNACTGPFGYVAHALQRNFCQCSWGVPYCHHCPCNMAYNAARGCCVRNTIIGSVNCH